jgi:hypothetical protein
MGSPIVLATKSFCVEETMAEGPQPTAGFHRFVGLCDDVLALGKDFAIVLFVVLFLFFGTYLRQKLDALGITKLGPIELGEVQKSNAQSKVAASQVDVLQQKLTDIESRLSEVNPHNPGAPTQIAALKGEIGALKSQATSAEESLKTSLLSQQDIIQKAVPQLAETIGWMYSGQVDESKKAWAGVGAKNISPVPPVPDFQPGQTFTVTSDVYLHSNPPGGSWHTQGDVVSVLKQGDRVQIVEVDTNSHAKMGGWFVWLRVKHSV